jgi:DNA invertase Pin-like site-specific DNA recombinase
VATYGYARVSTEGQSLDMQMDALREAGCDEVFAERASGTRDDRPELERMLARLREGDSVVIWKLDRLARSTRHLIELSERFERDGVALVSLRESIDTRTATGRLFFRLMASLAEFEADLTRERTRAGLEAARRRGRRPGPPVRCREPYDTARRLHEGGMTVAEACELAGISRETYYRYLRADQDGS